MASKLYVIPASHPCATVERALGLKGLPYERVDLAPVAARAVQRLRFPSFTVPGIVFDDGTKVQGSREILRELERRRPQPPLLPADASERARVEEAESWGDEVLQPLVRRVLWTALSRRPRALVSYSEGARLVPPTPAPVVRLIGPAVAQASRRLNRGTDAAVQDDLRRLPEHLDRVDGWIADGRIGGESPNAADLQIASSLRLLQTLADVAPLIDPRPAGDLARRVFPQYPGAVPAGTLPAAWLPSAPARAAAG